MKENLNIYRCLKCSDLIICYNWFPFEGLYCQCELTGTMDRTKWIKIGGELDDS